MSFWERATPAQKLAQIDAGIELGMTSAQVAMNCGCYIEGSYTGGGSDGGGGNVSQFALRHGRHFRGNRTAGYRAKISEANKFAWLRKIQDMTGVVPDAAHDIFEVQ